MKLYMVIEHFAPGAKEKIYERFHRKGRMLPEGLHYLNSWLEKDGDRCFQLMETNDSRLFDIRSEHATSRRWLNLFRQTFRHAYCTISLLPSPILPARRSFTMPPW